MASQKCPECGCTEIWDADCESCDDGKHPDTDEECYECGGSGYLAGLQECSSCGIIDADFTFDNEDE